MEVDELLRRIVGVLEKLELFEQGGSDKHLRDILGVLEISGSEIDQDYIRTWAERLGVLDLWKAILGRHREGH